MPGPAFQGEGKLVTLHFRALSARPTTLVALQQFAVTGADGKPLPVMAPRPVTLVVGQ